MTGFGEGGFSFANLSTTMTKPFPVDSKQNPKLTSQRGRAAFATNEPPWIRH